MFVDDMCAYVEKLRVEKPWTRDPRLDDFPDDTSSGFLAALRSPDTRRLQLSQCARDAIGETTADYDRKVLPIRPMLKLPHPRLWVETTYANLRFGLLLDTTRRYVKLRPELEAYGGDALETGRRGDGFCCTYDSISKRTEIMTFDFDFSDPRRPFVRDLPADVLTRHTHLHVLIEMLASGLSILWASPRVLEREERVPDAKLAKARARGGKAALLDYNVVRLSRTVREAVEGPGGTGGGSDRTHRLHWVRGHLRTLPTGRAVPVKGHMRGDATKALARFTKVKA